MLIVCDSALPRWIACMLREICSGVYLYKRYKLYYGPRINCTARTTYVQAVLTRFFFHRGSPGDSASESLDFFFIVEAPEIRRRNSPSRRGLASVYTWSAHLLVYSGLAWSSARRTPSHDQPIWRTFTPSSILSMQMSSTQQSVAARRHGLVT